MPKPEESAARFHRAARKAHERRKLTALINHLWQDNHLTEGFIAEARAQAKARKGLT